MPLCNSFNFFFISSNSASRSTSFLVYKRLDDFYGITTLFPLGIFFVHGGKDFLASLSSFKLGMVDTNADFSFLGFVLSCMAVSRTCPVVFSELNHGNNRCCFFLDDHKSFEVRIDHSVTLMEEFLPKNYIKEV